jgi:hypothetical protein
VEAIETLDAGAAHARGLRVRWASGVTVAEPGRDTPEAATVALRTAAERAGAAFVDASGLASGSGVARFVAADDATAVRLVRALVEAGVPVVEVTPDESRLERLFLEPGHAGPATPPAAGPPAPDGGVPPGTPYGAPGATPGGVAPSAAPSAPASDPARFMPPGQGGGA